MPPSRIALQSIVQSIAMVHQSSPARQSCRPRCEVREGACVAVRRLWNTTRSRIPGRSETNRRASPPPVTTRSLVPALALRACCRFTCLCACCQGRNGDADDDGGNGDDDMVSKSRML
eukprot:3483597-Rhodomonas_salina.2